MKQGEEKVIQMPQDFMYWLKKIDNSRSGVNQYANISRRSNETGFSVLSSSDQESVQKNFRNCQPNDLFQGSKESI